MARISTPKALTLTCFTYLSLTCSTTYAAEQVFVSLDKPCRLIDTRAPDTPFTHEGRQDFLAWSDGSPLTAQGGDNCELPQTDPKPSAIAANITAVSKPFHSKGNLLAYPFTGNNNTSDASLINFSDNNIANASVISLSPDANNHFSITGNLFNTTGAANSEFKVHVVVDVTGYFYEQAGTGIHLKNVVTVSQQGDGFTDPLAAMNSITDASSTNPYVLYIGPGNYNLSQALEMKAYVTIKGAGVGQTVLQGKAGSDFADDLGSSVMIGADHAAVTNLTLSNTLGSDSLVRRGIINKGVSPTIENVEFILKSLEHCVGILNENPNLDPNNKTSPTISHVQINVDCNNTAHGIFNFQGVAPVISYTHVSVSGSQSLSDGIHNTSGANATIRYSIIEGSISGIRSQKVSKATVSFSTILGGTALGLNPDNDNDSTAIGSVNLCGYSINGTGTVFNSQCSLSP